ncbi:hypothetical protein MNBD_GAMMA09-3595 [hydrothermal vent metagenome]|uniref:Phosphohistidine phosphatase SixA n=1 Tax=hydrothermal vent metagenome TaxID=652676 RepID=A0A3B0X250_9ZZZZ
MKTLFLARHAKSNWDQPANNDFERTLNDRGEADSVSMAALLQKNNYTLDQIISSDAVRALATARQYEAQLQPEHGLITNHDLYCASLQQLLQAIKNISSENKAVMLVGHNPGMSEVLNYLASSDVADMPTCSVGIIRFEVEQWRDVSIESSELLAFEYPEKHQ